MPPTKPVHLAIVLAACLACAFVAGAAAGRSSPAGLTGSAPARESAGASKSSTQTLVARVIRAYGGADKLKKLKEDTCRSRGKLKVTSGLSGAANTFDCRIVSRGEKLRIETTALGQTIVMGYDGDKCWTRFGDWVSRSSATTVKRMVEEIKHGLVLLCDLTEPSCRVRYLGAAAAQGKKCDLLEIVADDGKPTTFYVDESSGLVLRSQFMGTDQEQAVPALQATEYYDYRTVDGCPVPFRSVEFSGDKQKSEAILETVELSVEVADSEFAMPPESEVAAVKSGPVTVPFELVANVVVLKVRLDDDQEYRFILDTGASQTVLDKATAARIGTASESDFSITAGSKAMPVSYLTVERLSIGDLSLENIPALVTDLSQFAQVIGERPAGLIGANILRRFLTTVDFPDKQLILADPHNVEVPEGASVVPTSPIFGASALVVEGKLDGKVTLNFLVDTGAAFNNLPASTIRPLYQGPVLPVGEIFGVDGQKKTIGAIKLKALDLGPMQVRSPVFVISPDGDGKSAGGLFNAGSMGILGNPIWSRYAMTIDYRNERLILQRPRAAPALEPIRDSLSATEAQLMETRNLDQAVAAYQKIAALAEQERSQAGEALVLSHLGACYCMKSRATGNAAFLAQAFELLERASDLAKASGDRAARAEALARLGGVYLTCGKSQADVAAGMALIKQSIELAPQEPTAYALLAASAGKQPELQAKLADQALMLDPSNWRALWIKYHFFEKKGDLPKRELVAAQLRRYYPGSPEVQQLKQEPAAGSRGKPPPPRAVKRSAAGASVAPSPKR